MDANHDFHYDFLESYLTEARGDRTIAAKNMALDLMKDDPNNFKQGYTLRNAILAVRDYFNLDDEEYAKVWDRIG